MNDKMKARKPSKGLWAGIITAVLVASGGGVAWGVTSAKQAAAAEQAEREAHQMASSEYDTAISTAAAAFTALETTLASVDEYIESAPPAVLDALDYTVIDEAREVESAPAAVATDDLSAEEVYTEVDVQSAFTEATITLTGNVSEWLEDAHSAHVDYEQARLDKTSETLTNTIGKAERVLKTAKVREQDTSVRDNLTNEVKTAQDVLDVEVDTTDPVAIAEQVQVIVETNRSVNAGTKALSEAYGKWREAHEANLKSRAEREAAARQQHSSSSSSSSGHSPAGSGSGGSSSGSGTWTPPAPSGGSSGGSQPSKPAPAPAPKPAPAPAPSGNTGGGSTGEWVTETEIVHDCWEADQYGNSWPVEC